MKNLIFIDFSTIIVTIVVAGFLYSLYLTIYRLYLSPLAKFPGSKLAAATGWYEFYYDYWQNGKYIFEIEKMHRKYGMANPSKISV